MKKKILFWAIIGFVILGLVGVSISARNKAKYIQVKTVKVSKGSVKSFLSTTGTVKSKNRKDYYSLQGKVKSVKIKVGDKIKKGDILVVFDVPDMSTAVKQAEIQYENAVLQKSDLENKIVKISNQKSKLDKEISNLAKSKNPQDLVKLEQLKSQRESIQDVTDENIKQMNNSIELARVSLNDVKKKASENKDSIVSESDGIVTSVNIAEGAVSAAQVAQAAIVVQDLDNLEIQIQLGKFDANKVKNGQQAVVKNGNEEYKGQVSFISPAAIKTMGTTGEQSLLSIKIDVLDKNTGLKVDFDTDVDILLGRVDNVEKLPIECVKTDKDGNSSIFLLNNDKAEERKVKLGLQSDTDVEIKEGLKDGDKVILNPSASIKNGSLAKEAVLGAK